MPKAKATVPLMTEMRITVTRCTCGDPSSHPSAQCPQGVPDPSATRVQRSYRNPFRQLVWNLTRR